MKKKKTQAKPPTNFQIALAAIQKEFPGCAPPALSFAHRTKHTGVMLCPRAAALEREALGRSWTPRKDAHKLPCRLQVRVSQECYTRVKQLIEESGRYASVNGWLCELVTRALRQEEQAQAKRKAAEAAATALNGTENYTNVSIDGK